MKNSNKTNTYLEHANVTVPDIDASIEFLLTLEPNFQVRHDEQPKDSYRWAHIGSDQFYIALQEPELGTQAPYADHKSYRNFGVNHLAWVVEDFEATKKRLLDKGYELVMDATPHPHRKRAYFHDNAGGEWEIIGYNTSNPAERNAYQEAFSPGFIV